MNDKMYQNGGVTEKTDKQANRLVKKRTKIRKRRDKIEDREKEGKKVILKKFRKKRLNKKEDKVQDKINANPTAQKWRRDGKKKKALQAKPGFMKKGGKKSMYKTGGFNTGAGSWIESSSVSSID